MIRLNPLVYTFFYIISTWYQSVGNHYSGEEIEFVLNNIQICRNILWCDMWIKMAFNGLRLEYALKGSSNYIAWKDKMEAVLEDNGLKEFIDNDIPKLAVADASLLDAWKKKGCKCEEDLIRGSTRPHCLKSPWQRNSIYNVEGFDIFVSEYQ